MAFGGTRRIRCPRAGAPEVVTLAKSRSLAALVMTEGARGHRTGGSEDPPLQVAERTRYGWPTRRGVRQWRPSGKVKEHNEEQSLERVVDMEVSRKKD